MATLSQTYSVGSSPMLSARICAQNWIYAANILAEDPATANHANRVLWAKQVMREDQNGEMVRRMRVHCAQNSTIAAAGDDCTDNDIAYVIALHLDYHTDGVYGA
jgi:hypothetical protein